MNEHLLHDHRPIRIPAVVKGDVALGEPILLDQHARPLRDLRISVTDRCNFRCTYCMPRTVFGADFQFLPRSELLTHEEIERAERIFVSLGVSKIRITGGERSEEHTSELQSLMRISYAVFCLKKKTSNNN